VISLACMTFGWSRDEALDTPCSTTLLMIQDAMEMKSGTPRDTQEDEARRILGG